MISIGIDAGSNRWSGIKLDRSKILDSFEKDTEYVKNNVCEFSSFLVKFIENNVTVLPSAFGSKLTILKEVTDDELKDISLKRDGDTIIGLYSVLCELKKHEVNAYLIPSVKMLPTVPDYKKINKIDMGTSDKLCSAIYAMYAQSKRLNINLDETSFLLVEIGSSFTSLIFVDSGKIIDGIGGTSGPMGFHSKGAIDGELFSLKKYSKNMVYTGGLLDIKNKKIAESAFLNSLKIYVSGFIATNGAPKEIIISTAKDEDIIKSIASLLSTFSKVTLLERKTNASNAAYGAALLAADLTKARELVDLLQLDNANTKIVDFIF